MRSLARVALCAVAFPAVACAGRTDPDTGAAPATGNVGQPSPARVRVDTVRLRDPELERRLARLELRLMEKEAQVDELQTRLADSRDEIVSTMARLRGATSRAEAASGMAEADVAIQALRSALGQSPEVTQASRLAQQSTTEFNKENFGGALYLANQAKAIAASARARLAAGGRAQGRVGETAFVVPIRVRIGSKGNVREGPGTGYPVVFSLDGGTVVTALSYTDDWIRIADDAGRGGWIFRTLVTRP